MVFTNMFKNDLFIKDLFELIDQDAGFTNMNLIDLWEVGDVLVIEVKTVTFFYKMY